MEHISSHESGIDDNNATKNPYTWTWLILFGGFDFTSSP